VSNRFEGTALEEEANGDVLLKKDGGAGPSLSDSSEKGGETRFVLLYFDFLRLPGRAEDLLLSDDTKVAIECLLASLIDSASGNLASESRGLDGSLYFSITDSRLSDAREARRNSLRGSSDVEELVGLSEFSRSITLFLLDPPCVGTNANECDLLFVGAILNFYIVDAEQTALRSS